MIIKDFEYNNGYNARSITVEHDGKEYVIEPIRHDDRDDYTDSDQEFNTLLFRATEMYDCFYWSDKKQMYWSGECEVDDNDEPIENDDGQWLTAEEVKEYQIECMNEYEELHDALIARFEDMAAASAKELAAEEFMARPAKVIKEGYCSRVKDNCSDLDYEDILSERTGDSHHKIIAVCGRHMIERTENGRYTLWYVTGDDAEPYTTYRTLEDAIARLGEVEYNDGEVPAELLEGLTIGEEA